MAAPKYQKVGLQPTVQNLDDIDRLPVALTESGEVVNIEVDRLRALLGSTVGVGVPPGGAPGQVLAKIDSADYNTQWVDPGSEGGTPNLSQVAYSGDYLDLINRPTLGTAASANIADFDAAGAAQSALGTARAYTDSKLLAYTPTASLGSAAFSASSDFATAAQGSKADSALQPGANISSLTNDSGFITGTSVNALYVRKDTLNAAGGPVTLDVNLKIPTQYLPALAITDTFVAYSDAEMLALTAERGDVVVRPDIHATYILQQEPASVLANWRSLEIPGFVTSVFGRTGTITADGNDYATFYAPLSHVGTGGSAHALASASAHGFMSSTDKSKLDAIEVGAQKNVRSDWLATTGDALILNKPTEFPPEQHEHSANQITSGTFDDARISQSSVKQHEGSLEFNWSQIVPLSRPTTLGGYGITDAQPLDPILTGIANLTLAADRGFYTTAADAVSSYILTAAGRSIAGVAGTVNTIVYFSDNNVASLTSLTPLARQFLDDATQEAMRTTLGLGTAALLEEADVAPSSHVGSGDTAHMLASAAHDGFMSKADFNKLQGIATGATANQGTVYSVGMSLPASVFTVTNSPVTSQGTLTATLKSQTSKTFFAAPAAADGQPVFRTILATDLPDLSATYQVTDPALSSIAGLTLGPNQAIYTTGVDTFATYSITAAGRALAATIGNAMTVPYFSSLNTVSTFTITTHSINFLASTSQEQQRTSLGLGTAAVQNIEYFATADHGHSLNSLTDVDVGSPADNNLLVYSVSLGQWVSRSASGAGLAPLTHEHSANDLTSGTLDPARLPVFSGDVTAPGGSATFSLSNNVVTMAKLADIATGTFIGRNTAGTGDPEVLPIATVKTMLGLSGTNTGDQTITLNGDLSGSGQTGIDAVIKNSAVTNAKMANMAAGTIKGRIGTVGAPQDLTPAQIRSLINVADGATANVGTVTSVDILPGTGYTVSGGPIVNSGSFQITLSNNLLAWHALAPTAKQDALGYVPVQQGTGIDQTSDIVKLGWSTAEKLKLTVNSEDKGNLATEVWVEEQLAGYTPGENVVHPDDLSPVAFVGSNTDDLAEGSTNLYHSDQRAWDAVTPVTPANQFLASPTAADGKPVYRRITSDDLHGLKLDGGFF